MGSRRTIELCPNGKDILVKSKNRKHYVNLHIQHYFVMSIALQLARFSQGFSDVTTSSIKTFLFRSLYVEDLDKMLDGSGTDISVEDWKIVDGMSAEKKKTLLFFWTSIRDLP
uniref:HECT-type E3 ubiquitin transferase n=1 Tax=Solanum lycopersicum TaxID=4081 RepID=K4CTR1_SOLLC